MVIFNKYSIAALLILYCFIPGSAHATQQLPLYELAVKIDPARHTMQGLARITLQKGTACKINAQNFDLQQVLINNKDEKPLQGMIDIRAAQQDTLVEITYSASFAPGPAEEKEDISKRGRTQLYIAGGDHAPDMLVPDDRRTRSL